MFVKSAKQTVGSKVGMRCKASEGPVTDLRRAHYPYIPENDSLPSPEPPIYRPSTVNTENSLP